MPCHSANAPSHFAAEWRCRSMNHSYSHHYNVLDSTGPRRQRLGGLIDRETRGDHRSHRVGPSLDEYPEVADSCLKAVRRRVDAAENHLVVQHDIAHDVVGIHFNGSLATGHTGKDEHAIGPETLNDFEGDV